MDLQYRLPFDNPAQLPAKHRFRKFWKFPFAGSGLSFADVVVEGGYRFEQAAGERANLAIGNVVDVGRLMVVYIAGGEGYIKVESAEDVPAGVVLIGVATR